MLRKTVELSMQSIFLRWWMLRTWMTMITALCINPALRMVAHGLPADVRAAHATRFDVVSARTDSNDYRTVE